LAKPFTEEELLHAVTSALGRLRLRRAGAPTDEPVSSEWGLLSASPAMRRVFRDMKKASPSNATVLISGESGTGKELVARAIHYQGPRRAAPFVPVNCGGIPDGLLESELFGYRKGAFTGASESRAGFFQTAEGGSIFLDEVAELSLPMQAALLRVLQDKMVYMIGVRQPAAVDVRVLAATNRDLQRLVEQGKFREDLYYRLNVLPIVLPPLRERGDDVLILVRHFAEKFAGEMRKKAPPFTERALALLQAYSWPGNVRELENIVQRLVLMVERDVIDAADLPALMRFSADGDVQQDSSLAEAEAAHVRAVLAGVNGNKTRAAQILGIDRKTLREKIKEH
ncbi:MAG: sigma-54 dependent transcriptional regulator, partial [Kiritimatiellae bacterium]|nr:sigma-54 dependent transcriptional regulator [Kiritimatiellia bacterium]